MRHTLAICTLVVFVVGTQQRQAAALDDTLAAAHAINAALWGNQMQRESAKKLARLEQLHGGVITGGRGWLHHELTFSIPVESHGRILSNAELKQLLAAINQELFPHNAVETIYQSMPGWHTRGLNAIKRFLPQLEATALLVNARPSSVDPNGRMRSQFNIHLLNRPIEGDIGNRNAKVLADNLLVFSRNEQIGALVQRVSRGSAEQKSAERNASIAESMRIQDVVMPERLRRRFAGAKILVQQPHPEGKARKMLVRGFDIKDGRAELTQTGIVTRGKWSGRQRFRRIRN